MHWTVEVYAAFWRKEKEARAWDFKGKAGDSQVDKREQTRSEQILAAPSEAAGPKGKVNKQLCGTSFSTSATFSLCHGTQLMPPPFKQIFLSEFFQAGKGGGSRVLLESFVS